MRKSIYLKDIPFARVQIEGLRKRCEDYYGLPVYGVHFISNVTEVPHYLSSAKGLLFQNLLMAYLDAQNSSGGPVVAYFDPDTFQIFYIGQLGSAI